MKLLFDENLSPKLPNLLSIHFPGSIHVRDCGMKGFADSDIWEYAKVNDFTIISKDADFYQKTLLYGSPPKLVWLRIGNCTRKVLFDLVIRYKQDIYQLNDRASESVLVISI